MAVRLSQTLSSCFQRKTAWEVRDHELGYVSLMGRLAMPSLLAQALSPSLGAILIEWRGPGAAFGLLARMATLNIIFVGLLWTVFRPAIQT